VLPVDLLAHSPQGAGRQDRYRPCADRRTSSPAPVSQVGDPGRQTIARNGLLAARIPRKAVPGTTVDRQCGSSQQPISFAAAGCHRPVRTTRWSAAGVESMSTRADGVQRASRERPRFGAMAQRYPEGLRAARVSAPRLIAARWGFSRPAARRVFRRQPRKRPRRQPKRVGSTNELIPINGLTTDENHPPPARPWRRSPASSRRFYNPAFETRFPQIKLGDHPGQLLNRLFGRQRSGADHHQ